MKTKIKSTVRGKDYFLYPKTNGKGWIVEWSESGKKASFSNLKVEGIRKRIRDGEIIKFRDISYTVSVESAIVHLLKDMIHINKNKKTYSLIKSETPHSTEMIKDELNRRIKIWEEISKFPDGNVHWHFLKDKKVIVGERGIYRDLKNTRSLTSSGYGLTVAVRHTGGRYPDELSEDELIYHYPETKNKNHDFGEIFGTKECLNLNLPIFVILEGESKSTKKVKLGWVQDFDDDEKIFFIEFSEKKPLYKHIEEQTPFTLTDFSKRGKSTVNTRPNQTRFRFSVTRNYGYKCAVCSINIPELLEAIHIRDKKYNGSDDWRNGLFLCLNHHKAFDKYLFKINPDDFSIKVKYDDLKIEEKYLKTKTGKIPHVKALKWRWKRDLT